MENIKQFVIDYLEGSVSSDEFLDIVKNDSSVLEWLQSIVPQNKKSYSNTILHDGTLKQDICPFSVSDMINNMWMRIDLVGKLSREYEILCAIERLMKEAFPNLILRSENPIKEKWNFMLDACPEYVLSVEVEESGILDRIIDELPKDISRSKRIKLFREQVKAEFGIERQTYPRWVQQSEWPMSLTGKPMKYLSSRQIRKKEIVVYIFVDVDTGEERVIQQAY